MVVKLKVTRKLEEILPAFLFAIPRAYSNWYLPKYISDSSTVSTRDIDLPTSFAIPKAQHTLSPK